MCELSKEELATYQLHPKLKTITDILSTRTQNPDKNFFIIQSCFYLAKLASSMRAYVDAQGMGKHQINFYGINCAPSGYGKGHATRIIEEQIIDRFTTRFKEDTLVDLTEKNLIEIANKRSIKYGEDYEKTLESVGQEFKRLGVYVDCFDSGTAPALKQLRHQLLMRNIGSINYIVDEIGNNLLAGKDIFDVYLELFDGVVKQKLIKNTADSVRNEEIIGKTPTNMLLFGTPSMLLDGGAVERAFMDMNITGFARRCFYGFSAIDRDTKELTMADRLALLSDNSSDATLSQLSIELEKLSDPINKDFCVYIPTDVLEQVVRYQMYCEKVEQSFRSTDEMRRAEARGRHYKTLRLAGVFAFIDSAAMMDITHWQSAVKVAELSAQSFYDLLSRPPAHARLAIYLSEAGEPTTYAELMEDLPYFPRAANAQKDMVKNCIAWGYKHNVIIKRSHTDEIEFLQGESLKESDPTDLIVSYSTSDAYDYAAPKKKFGFEQLAQLVQMKGYNWCSHQFIDEHRNDKNTIMGFNLLVLDIDGTATLNQAKHILDKYAYFIHTTKSHADDCHCFRIVLPMSHILKLSKKDYKQFMENVYEFLPFDTDEQTGQPSRKWACCETAQIYTHEGQLFDVLPFISKTKKNEERRKFIETTQSMDKLERYFFMNAEEGNRSNTLVRYGFALVDGGYDFDTITLKVTAFNSKLPKPLAETELQSTVLYSTMKKFSTKNTH